MAPKRPLKAETRTTRQVATMVSLDPQERRNATKRWALTGTSWNPWFSEMSSCWAKEMRSAFRWRFVPEKAHLSLVPVKAHLLTRYTGVTPISVRGIACCLHPFQLSLPSWATLNVSSKLGAQIWSLKNLTLGFLATRSGSESANFLSTCKSSAGPGVKALIQCAAIKVESACGLAVQARAGRAVRNEICRFSRTGHESCLNEHASAL